MNRITTLLVLGLMLTFSFLNAQSTLSISPQSTNAETGDTINVAVSVTGFQNIIGVEWKLTWNSTLLEFIEVNSFALPDVTFSTNFNDDPAATGELSFSWNGEEQSFPNGSTIYNMKMVVKGSGQTAPIAFTGTKQFITFDGLLDITSTDGEVVIASSGQTGDGPVTFIVESDSTSTSNAVCIDIKVNNFDSITSVQYVLKFDPSVVQYDSVSNLGLPQLTVDNFGDNIADLNAGNLIFTWNYESNGDEGVTLVDGSTIYSVCFTALGAGGTNSPIKIDSIPPERRVEVSNSTANNIPYIITNGNVKVTGTDTGASRITVRASEETVEEGESVCVKVSVEDFEDIFGLSWTMNYDPNILQFTELKSFAMPGLDVGDFTTTTAGQAQLFWTDPSQNGVTIADGTTIFEICFDAIGDAATNSDISFGNTPVVIEAAGPNNSNVDVRTFDGNVVITAAGGFILTVGDTNGNTGDTVCVPVSVSGFNEVLFLQWSMAWDQNVLKYVRVQNFGLTGFRASRVSNNSPGQARVLWDDSSANGVTLSDGTVIYEVCFEILGDSGTNSDVEVTSTPLAIEVETEGEIAFPPVTTIKGLITVGSTAILTIDEANTQVANVNCFGESNGSIDLVVTGGAAPLTFAWSDGGATTDERTSLAAGNYTVTVTDAGGEMATATFSVSQPAAALALGVPNVTNETAFNANDGAIDISVSGGTSAYTFAWSNNATTEDISGLAGGDYTVTITDANGCTLISEVITVQGVDGTELIIDNAATIVTSVNCFGEATGAIDLVVFGGMAPLTFAWSDGGVTTEDRTALVAGNYTVTVNDADSQSKNFTFTVTTPSTALNITNPIINDNSTCSGTPSGSIDLSVSGGTPNYTFAWSNGSDSGDLTGLAEGDYSVTITDANSCSIIGGPYTVDLSTGGSPVNIDITSTTNPSCNGEATGVIDITVTGGVQPLTFAWTNGGSVVNNLEDLSGLFAGTYDALVTDANGCTATQAISLTQPSPIFLASTNITNETASGTNDGAIDITVMGGTTPYTFAWSNTATSEDLVGIPGGNYTVSITDANGCTFTSENIFVNIDNLSPISIGGDVNNPCFGENNGSITLAVSGGMLPYNYAWNNGAGNVQDLSGLGAGTYTVTVTDEVGQEATRAFTIIAPTAAISISSESIVNETGLKNDGSINITPIGGEPPYSFVWSNGDTSEDISGLSANTYRVSITDANNCLFISEDYVVSYTPFPMQLRNVEITNPTCSDENNGSIEITIAGGDPSYTFEWSNEVTDIYNEVTPVAILNNLPSGSYGLTVTDGNGQLFETLVEVTAPSALSVADIDISLPTGSTNDNGAINLTISGGTTPYTFAWSNGQTTEDVNGLASGEYNVSIIDANGCETTETIIVGVGALGAAINGVTDEDCPDSNGGAIDISVFGGQSPYSYKWSNGATTEDINEIPAGIYGVTITDTDNNEFIFSDIEVNALSDLTVSGAVTSNYNGGFNVSGNGRADGSAKVDVSGGEAPYTYTWTSGNPIGDGSQVTGLSGGTHTVVVVDAAGCQQTIAVELTQPQALTASMDVLTQITCSGECNGRAQAVAAGGVPPYNYQWDAPDSFGDLATNLCHGTYNVIITDANNVEYMATFNFNEPSSLILTTSSKAPSSLDAKDGEVEVSISGGTSPYIIQWNDEDGCTTERCTGLPFIQDSLFVIVSDANGCMEIASVKMETPESDCFQGRPVITPDGDGLNENFMITCVEDAENTLEIYNRWGQLVYRTENYDNSWNAETLRGNELPDGGYFYVLEIIENGEVTEQIKGSITVLRGK